jgi:hypothetical protein
MEEDRQHPRTDINITLRLVEDSTGIVLGTILDISWSGVRITSAEDLTEGDERTGRLDFSFDKDDDHQIVLDITPVRSRPGKDGQTEYGCMHDGLIESDLNLIMDLIE